MPVANPLYTPKIGERVYIYLVNGVKIEGILHMPPRTRLTDNLNKQVKEKPFIPLTDAKITDPDGKENQSPFIIINKNQITICVPLTAPAKPGQ